MKLLCHLCFLVLAISSLARGKNDTEPSSEKYQGPDKPATTDSWTTTRPQNETKNESASPPPPIQPSQTPTAITMATAVQTTNVSVKLDYNITDTAEDAASGDDQESKSGPDDDKTHASTSSSPTPGTTVPERDSPWGTTEVPERDSPWGQLLYVILAVIFLMIIVLCVILYFLRRLNRSYSFDLQRPSPSSHRNEPTGTFEAVNLDDLDRPAPKDTVIIDDLSTSPVANGTNLQSDEKVSNGENAVQEQPDANGVQNSPTSNTSSPSTDAQAEEIAEPLSMTDLLFDAVGEDQNENNNNNPSGCPSGPFVEINLDEPAWCDQLFTSPHATSSVLPFSPFSFSTSS